MTELKFIAWDEQKKEILTKGFCLVPTSPTWSAFIMQSDAEINKKINHHYLKQGDIIGGDYFLIDAANFYGIIHLKVMQYSGFNDDFGVEIYSGFILQGRIASDVPHYEVRLEKGVFELYSKFGYWGTLKNGMSVFKDYEIPIKVIGNIYQNPELKVK